MHIICYVRTLTTATVVSLECTIALSSMLNLACFEMEVAFDILAVEVAG